MFDIISYGAIGDGQTQDGPAIQKAIDACHQVGGGMVYVPPGQYLTGTIQLKSHLTLHLEAGAHLISSTCQDDFIVYQPPEHYTWKADRCGLICGKELEQVTITGKGRISGRDKSFWTPIDMLGEGWNTPPPRYLAKTWRPMTLLLENCRQVLIQGVTIEESPAYSGWFINCSLVQIRDVLVLNDFYGPNTDGFHFSSCQWVQISGCHFQTGDDALAFDSNSMNPAQDVTISNCTFHTSVNALRIYTGLDPGMTGDEDYGLVRNISMSNCAISNAAGVINVTAQNGLIEGLVFSNLAIRMEQEGTPFFLMTDKGQIRNVLISHITAQSNGACTMIGSPEYPVEAVTLSHIRFDLYPKKKMYGLDIPDPIPSYAHHHYAPYNLYIRHAKNIRLQNITLQWFDTRLAGSWPAIYSKHTEDLIIEGFQGKQAGNEKAVIQLDDVKDAKIVRCRAAKGAGTFLLLRGSSIGSCSLCDNDLNAAKKDLVYEN